MSGTRSSPPQCTMQAQTLPLSSLLTEIVGADLDLNTDATTEQIYSMHLEANRLETFIDNNWPFNSEDGPLCLCTPAKMASAGFYYAPTEQEPDCVVCYVCQKELEGWKPEDDPWAEHASHCPRCPFVLVGKREYQFTVKDFLKLENQCQVIRVRELGKRRLEKFNTEVEATRLELAKFIQTQIRREMQNIKPE